MSRHQQDLERGFRMLAAYDHACERRPLVMAAAREQMWRDLEAWANSDVYMDEQERRLRDMQQHPSMQSRSRECTPATWSPAPDPIHWHPRMSNWDIVRDLIALAWKAVRR
ncbi:hypothetical protein ACLQ3K_25860 [Tsukamurella sp. DT100]|uniref:hypothetical protein n=1 Tax=Tsukamurella sp. DT100 TaxID=3393415 RepID=UPI003CF609E5